MESDTRDPKSGSKHFQTDQMQIAGYIAGVLKIAPLTYGRHKGKGFRAVFPIPEEEGRRYEAKYMTSEAKMFDDAVLHFKRTTFGSRI